MGFLIIILFNWCIMKNVIKFVSVQFKIMEGLVSLMVCEMFKNRFVLIELFKVIS